MITGENVSRSTFAIQSLNRPAAAPLDVECFARSMEDFLIPDENRLARFCLSSALSLDVGGYACLRGSEHGHDHRLSGGDKAHHR